jgi:hypothetical protein
MARGDSRELLQASEPPSPLVFPLGSTAPVPVLVRVRYFSQFLPEPDENAKVTDG